MSKRKLLLLSAAILLAAAILLTGCGQNGGDTAGTAAQTEAETLYSDLSELEWTLIDCPIFLKDNYYLYAENEDFLYFAFVGTNESNAELKFMLDDVTANMLKEQSPDNHYYISIGEEETHIGDVTLSDDCKVVTLKGQHPYDEMISIATRIRGLDK